MNLTICGCTYVHATFPELANYIQRVKTLILVYFFCKLPARKRYNRTSCTRISTSIFFPLYYEATHFPISAHRFRTGRILPSIRATGDRLCKYYARVAARLFDLLVCYVSRAAYANNAPYAKRHCGLNACSQSPVSSSNPSFISFSLSQLLDKCHRLSIAIIDPYCCENILSDMRWLEKYYITRCICFFGDTIFLRELNLIIIKYF